MDRSRVVNREIGPVTFRYSRLLIGSLFVACLILLSGCGNDVDDGLIEASGFIEGEEIVIAKAGVPLAKLVALPKPKEKRKPGGWKGKIRIADNFDAPLPANLQAAFEGRVYEDQ